MFGNKIRPSFRIVNSTLIRNSMKIQTTLLTLAIALASPFAMNATAEDSVHEFKVKDIEGKDVNLADYKGKPLLISGVTGEGVKPLLIVNVASKCGATPQYENLQAVYEQFKDKGLVILGFPANNYGGQEPGTDEEIKTFCTSTYDVSFPMFSKVSVKGDDQAPLFKYLTAAENPDKQGDIGWNFEKFLVNKDGKLIRRFATGTKPDAPEVTEAITKALAE